MTISNFQLIILALRVLALVALIAAIGWFAWKANRMDKNPLAWGLLAAAAYLIPSRLVRTLVIYVTDGIEQTSGNIFALVALYHLPPLFAGILGCYLLKMFLVDGKFRESAPTESG